MNKVKFKRSFVIGTANFSKKYGASSTVVNKSEIKKIINLAKKNKIYNLDTAETYFKNKDNFKNIEKKFIFFSKLIANVKWLSLEYCQNKIQKHLQNFNSNSVDTIFVHNAHILKSKIGPNIFKNLENLKKKKYFKNIGISIYDPNCLDNLINNYDFDIVQCPFNILDKRLISTGWYEKLKKKKIKIHVRSIFLQGLLVDKKLYKKKYFTKWEKTFFKWFQFLKNKNISPIDYCLTDLMNYNFDKVIFGINNSENLKEIINFKSVRKNNMRKFNIDDKRLIDPRNWK